MARSCFYSFEYKPDNWRVSQIRNIGAIEGNKPATDNDWESVAAAGDAAIKRWIDGQMKGRSCVIVMIGASTAGRKWINYEIEEGWKLRKGILGIHIHNLKNRLGQQSHKGNNPFATYNINGTPMNQIVPVYDPPYTSSNYVYDHIKNNVAGWIEHAIAVRNKY